MRKFCVQLSKDITVEVSFFGIIKIHADLPVLFFVFISSEYDLIGKKKDHSSVTSYLCASINYVYIYAYIDRD